MLKFILCHTQIAVNVKHALKNSLLFLYWKRDKETQCVRWAW